MKKAGCWLISYGIESGCQRILNLLNKRVTLEQIEKTVAATKKAGLRVRGFFMIGHFGETRESILQTIDFMRKIPLDDFNYTVFTPMPGTPAYNIADRYGTFDRTWSKMNFQYIVFVPNGLTADEIERYSRLGYRKFYFRPQILIPYLLLLLTHPTGIRRLFHGLQAVLLRIFAKKHCVPVEEALVPSGSGDFCPPA